VDDLAQYSPLRRPKRRFEQPEPFRFQTPIVFRLAPVVPLTRPRRDPHAECWRRFG
jgi:hypothetical protein